MVNAPMHRLWRAVIVASCCLLIQIGDAQESKTVLGPANPELAQGADELLAGNAEEGVRLSLIGLQHQTGRRDKLAGLSNLCAGYFMLDQLDTALLYCNRALEEDDKNWRALNNRALIYVTTKRYLEAEQDILKGQQLAPNSRNLKIVRSMLLDATDPVSPNIIIDERRQPPPDEND